MTEALYVYPSDRPSEAAIRLAKDIKSIDIIDISKERELPPYVDGVPLLADEKTEWRGSQCLKRLKELKDLDPPVKALGEPDDEDSNFVGDLGFTADIVEDPKKDLDKFMRDRSSLLKTQDPRNRGRRLGK